MKKVNALKHYILDSITHLSTLTRQDVQVLFGCPGRDVTRAIEELKGILKIDKDIISIVHPKKALTMRGKLKKYRAFAAWQLVSGSVPGAYWECLPDAASRLVDHTLKSKWYCATGHCGYPPAEDEDVAFYDFLDQSDLSDESYDEMAKDWEEKKWKKCIPKEKLDDFAKLVPVLEPIRYQANQQYDHLFYAGEICRVIKAKGGFAWTYHSLGKDPGWPRSVFYALHPEVPSYVPQRLLKELQEVGVINNFFGKYIPKDLDKMQTLIDAANALRKEAIRHAGITSTDPNHPYSCIGESRPQCHIIPSWEAKQSKNLSFFFSLKFNPLK